VQDRDAPATRRRAPHRQDGMKVFGFAGWSGSGKTTLIERLIPHFTARGLRVSLIKHAHHGFDVDVPGKDSYRHRQAGCTEVLVGSGRRWALMHELRDEPEPTLDEQIGRMAQVDLLLIEGFKRSPVPKLEVHRSANGKPPLYDGEASIVAVATDRRLSTALPQFDLDDFDAIAGFILAYNELA
jgi:molybdopterin-guanine dinucleotide biosynthesis protein B